MRSLALGWRLARRSWRSSIGRTASMALGMMLAGFVAAALLGLPAIFDGKNDRRDANALVLPEELRQAEQAGDVPSDFSDWTFQGRHAEEGFGVHTIRRVMLSGAGDLPPGVEALPLPGEIVMSPALADLVQNDSLVAQRFPQQQIGTIAEAGLMSPGDLVAYVGVEPDERLFPVAFGTTDSSPIAGTSEVRIVMAMAAAFLALPAAAFLVTSSRLSARARDQRLASLRLVGLSRRAVRTVNAVETAIVAGVGSAIGCLAWIAVQPWIGRWSVGGFRWFAADAPTGPLTILGIVVAAIVGAVTVATVTANAAVDEPLATERNAAPTVRVGWRAIVLVAGIAMLVAASVVSVSNESVFFLLLFIGGLTAAVGTALATPVISQALGAWLGSAGAGTTRMLVAGRLRHEPSAAGRVLTGVLMATFALGVGQGVIGAFQDASGDFSEDSTTIVDSDLSPDEMASLPGVAVAIPQIDVDPASIGGVSAPGSDSGWAATCAQLETLLGDALPSCVDDQIFELSIGFRDARLGVPVLEAELPTDSSSSITGLIVPPSQADLGAVTSWTVRLDPERRTEFDAALVAADPVAFTGSFASDNLDDLVAAVITAGAIAAFTIGLAAVAVATADRAIERRSLDANLLAVGIPGRYIRRAQLWTVSLPVAVSVTTAAIVGTFAGHIYRQAGSSTDQTFPWTVALLSSGAGLLGAALAGSLAYYLAQTRLATGDLRTA